MTIDKFFSRMLFVAQIPEQDIERLKQEVSIKSLVESRGVGLKKHGADWIGLCFFHQDKNPSLLVSPQKGLWHCLGACRTGGSVIDWVMKRGSQEGLIGELKSCVHFDYIACRRQIANKHIMATSVLAHNLGRELQMQAMKQDRGLAPKRPALWSFQKLSILRQQFPPTLHITMY